MAMLAVLPNTWLDLLKVLIPALLTALLTYRISMRGHDIDAASKDAQAQHQLSAGAAEIVNAHTARFEKIMDAAEARIDDLMREIAQLRKDVVELQNALHYRAAACGACPHFVQAFQSLPVSQPHADA